MKRTRTSMTLFLGIWVAGSVVAYTASRQRAFAGNGQNSCVPCENCVFTYCYWVSGVATVFGWLDDETKQPCQNAITAGQSPIYTGLICDLEEQEKSYLVDAVDYVSCDGDCVAPLPQPQGVYTGSNGQRQTEPYNTFNGGWCITP